MTGPDNRWKFAVAIAIAALLVACAVDIRFYPALPWVLALYVLPLLVCVGLPVPVGLAIAVITLVASAGVGVLNEQFGWSAERLVSVVEILVLSSLVVYVRAARDEIERNNERVAGILDGSDTGFVRTRANLEIRDANGPWLRMVGARRSGEVVGTRLPDWFPEERRRAAEVMLAFLEEGDRRGFETEIRQVRGARIHVVVTAYAERVGDEVVISAVFADVSAIRRAEAEARASEQQLRSHLERTPLAAVVLDEQHLVRDWNHAAERIFGFPRGEALGMSAWKLVPEEARADRTVPFGNIDTTERRGGYERIEQITHDGRRVLVQWYHTPIPGPDGALQRVASLGLDVTREHEIEQALRVSETKFATVFQQSPDVMCLVRLRDNALLEVNEAVRRMFGWSPVEVHNTWARFETFWAHPEDLQRFSDAVRNQPEIEAFETEMLDRQGRPLSVLVSARRLRVQQSTALLLTIRDLTAIREAEAQRRELEQQLQQAQRMEGIGRLAGGVAHDFNNMLAGVQGYAELIQVQAAQRGQVEHYASRILETTRRAAELVGKLLTFSRRGAVQKRYFDVQDVVRDTLDLVSQTLDSSIRVVDGLEAPRCAVYGDESQISNAVLNLCVNARDAIGSGGTITVTSECVPLDERSAAQLDPDLTPGEYVVLRVVDDGCGIAEDALPNIFVPFFTTKREGRGTGLGLPSVYGAAKGHGGTVTVKSEVGQGSSFSIYLPSWPAASIVAETTASGTERHLDLSGKRVLVIDDEMAVRDTLARSLQRLGCVVKVAADGREGLMRFEDDPEHWALVLLDVSLPELSGEDVYRAIASRRTDLPVLLISGNDRSDQLKGLLAEGAAGVLQKPFSRDELLAEIDRVLHSVPPEPPARLRVVRNR